MTVPLMFQPLVKYAQFEGRSRRSEFWLWILFRFLLNQLMGAVALAFIGPMFADFGLHPDAINAHPEIFFQNYMTMWMRILPFFSVISLALLVPTLTVAVRRLHDINRTGWWVVLPYGVMIVGVIIFLVIGGVSIFNLFAAHPNGNVSDAEGIRTLVQVIGSMFLCVVLPALIAWIVLLVFFVTEGTRGPNRFGPDPKASLQPEVL